MGAALSAILGLLVVAVPLPARAGAGAGAGDRGNHRFEIGLAGEMITHFPMSETDGGPVVFVATPLWLGVRYPGIQWVADLEATLGYGVTFRAGYLSVTPRFGFDWFIGSVVGLEVRLGLGLLAQVGSKSVAGVGMTFSAAWSLRLWPDEGRRLAIGMLTETGGYLAPDPGNDMGMNAMRFGLGVSYEAAW